MAAGKNGRMADAAEGTRSATFVRVRGAREHNLKNVDADIPRDALCTRLEHGVLETGTVA